MASNRIVQHSVIAAEKTGSMGVKSIQDCFYSGVCVSDVGRWERVEDTGK